MVHIESESGLIIYILKVKVFGLEEEKWITISGTH